MDTTESLNATLNLMHPPMTQNVNVTSYFCKSIDEGKPKKFSTEINSVQCRNQPENPSHIQEVIGYIIKKNIDEVTKRKKVVPSYTD